MTTQNALEAIGVSVDGVSKEALVAIVRRLQAENDRLRENAKTISELEQLAARSNNDLLVENERLRKDAEKLQDTPVRYVSLQHIKLKVTDANPNPVRVNVIAERDGAWLDMPHEKVDIMRTEMQSAIDAARGAK